MLNATAPLMLVSGQGRWLMRRIISRKRSAGDLEGAGADLVEGVLLGVVVAVGGGVGVGAVVEVDDVEDRDAALREGEVVVIDRGLGS